METELYLNSGWRFHLGDCPDAWQKWYQDEAWEQVDLPHDWSVTQPFSRSCSSGTGYLEGGIGWYRLTLDPGPDFDPRTQSCSLLFEGIYKNAQVWVNSYYLGQRPNGYIPQLYDITPFVEPQRSLEISVRVDHQDIADSRWFTGSGIYRPVKLLIRPLLQLVTDGTYFHCLKASAAKAEYVIQAEVINRSQQAQDCCLSSLLKPEDKRTLPDHPETIDNSLLQSTFSLAAGEVRTITLKGELSQPLLWQPQTPWLYDLTLELKSPDFQSQAKLTVGLRTLEFKPDRGLLLNGRPTKLKGVCVHHDAGCLGAAVYPSVWLRRLETLKSLGCNAIRMSHNPHLSRLYDLCDRLGLLVMDEIFDEWEGPKNKWSTGHNVYPPKHQGYYEAYPDWHARDVRDWVRRDRNHPSVMAWSVGNEIDYPNDPYCHPEFQSMTGNNDANKPEAERQYNPDRPNATRLAALAAELARLVRQEDPYRPATIAAAFPELSSQIGFLDPFSLVGYNYKEQFYDQDHQRFPDKTFVGSENAHSYEAWQADQQRPYIAGQFLWTGIDYLGEAPGWPVHGSAAGLLTLAGFKKGVAYFRHSLWADEPVLHLVTRALDPEEITVPEIITHDYRPRRSWNYRPGQKVLVYAFTNQTEVTLTLNGRRIAEHAVVDLQQGYLAWVLEYEPGQISAEAYPQDFAEAAAKDRLLSSGPAVQLKLCQWQPRTAAAQAAAVTDDIRQIEIQVSDAQGQLVTEGRVRITVSVKGPARLLGLENGDLADYTDYQADYRSSFGGKLIAYVKYPSAETAESEPVELTAGTAEWGDFSLHL
ncbi:glycoside hydrolase family 2 protein [Oscillospiraceae bacterium HV4-5-C5C]|nr:glycoside hydrolase family 2 protein [Oscillospiraceae bacterium HV4-5-C5C]